jgi:hypothetical protein
VDVKEEIKAGERALVAKDDAELKGEPKPDGEVVATLPKDSRVKVLQVQDAWLEVKVEMDAAAASPATGKSGWILRDDVSRLDPEPRIEKELVPGPIEAGKEVVVAKNDARLMRGSDLIAQLPIDSRLKIRKRQGV